MSLFKRLLSSVRPEADAKPAETAATTAHSEPFTWPALERRIRKRINAKHGLTALIIDDSPTIVAALGKTLRSSGYATITAADAEAGLELAKQERPDLIFLDIILPGMNGFAALRVIRKEPSLQATPVIMISGNEHATEQFYAGRIGADDFMKKPFSRIEVFSRIESLLDADLIPRRKGVVMHAAHDAAAIVAEPLTMATAPSAELSAAANMLAARKDLTTMGLQYFNQAQYDAAVLRGDQLATALFIRGGGIQPAGSKKPSHAHDLAALPVSGQQPN